MHSFWSVCPTDGTVTPPNVTVTPTNGTVPPTNVTRPPTNGTMPVYCGSGLTCYNGGRCNSSFNCICPSGYQGYDCSRESCEWHRLTRYQVQCIELCHPSSLLKVKDVVQTMELAMKDTAPVHLVTVEDTVKLVSSLQ